MMTAWFALALVLQEEPVPVRPEPFLRITCREARVGPRQVLRIAWETSLAASNILNVTVVPVRETRQGARLTAGESDVGVSRLVRVDRRSLEVTLRRPGFYVVRVRFDPPVEPDRMEELPASMAQARPFVHRPLEALREMTQEAAVLTETLDGLGKINEELKKLAEETAAAEKYRKLRDKLAASGKGLDSGDRWWLLETQALTLEIYRLLDQILLLAAADPSKVKDHHEEESINKERPADDKGRRYDRETLVSDFRADMQEHLDLVPRILVRESALWIVRWLRHVEDPRLEKSLKPAKEALVALEKLRPENPTLKRVREAVNEFQPLEEPEPGVEPRVPAAILDDLEKFLREP